ncbi:MAG: winged helix-turn-helix domain-containing protein [Algicola sp.]|nr:winged helix-turn-helix domain-containing protein [Algicola sp.]
MYQLGQFQFDENEGVISGGPTSVSVRPKTAQLLLYLIEHRDRVISKDELFEKVWQGRIVGENTLVQGIAELRKAFADPSREPIYIKTYPLRGYRWIFEAVEQSLPIEVKLDELAAVQLNPYTKASPIKALVVISLLITLVGLFYFTNNQTPSTQPPVQIAVLPVINDTGDPQLDWIELGLTDMIVSGLNRGAQTTTTSSIAVQQILANNQIAQRSMGDSELNTVLLATNADHLLRAYVRKDADGLLRFHYSLYHASGASAESFARFDDIAAAVPQILKLLYAAIGQSAAPAVRPSYSLSPGANENYAKGLDSLNRAGATVARHYFEAALKLDPQFEWAKLRLAQSLFELGQWPASQRLFEQLRQDQNNQKSQNKDPLLDVLILINMAKLATVKGDDVKARQLNVEALTLVQAESRMHLQAMLLSALAQIDYRQGDFAGQRQYREQLEALLQQRQSEAQKAGIKLSLSGAAQIGEDQSLSAKRLAQALDYFQQQGNLKAEAQTHRSLGQNATLTQAQRQTHFKQALSLFEQLQSPAGLGATQTAMAYFLIEQGKSDGVVQLLETAGHTYKTLGAVDSLAWNHFYLGLAKLTQVMAVTPEEKSKGKSKGKSKERSKAQSTELLVILDHFSQANGFFSQTGQRQNMAQSQLFLTLLSFRVGNIDDAVRYAKSARQLFEAIDLPLGWVMADLAMAAIEMARQQWSLALSYLDKVPATMSAQWFLIDQYKARCYYETGQYADAVSRALAAKESAKEAWQPMDQFRLTTYQKAGKGVPYVQLPPERDAFKAFWAVRSRIR